MCQKSSVTSHFSSNLSLPPSRRRPSVRGDERRRGREHRTGSSVVCRVVLGGVRSETVVTGTPCGVDNRAFASRSSEDVYRCSGTVAHL